MVNSNTLMSAQNPMGMDGIEFVEFATTEPGRFGRHLETLGFNAVARHRSKNVLLYRQGSINFIVNGEEGEPAYRYAKQYGAGICALAFRVKDATAATQYVIERGAWEVETAAGVMELRIPAFQGVGGSLIYLVDRYQDHSIYDVDFVWLTGSETRSDTPLLDGVDQVIQRVQPGRLKEWLDFYAHLFGFGVRQQSGPGECLIESPCGKVRIRLETIEGVRSDGSREGLHAVRLLTADLPAAAAELARRGVRLGESLTPDAYAPRVFHTLHESGQLDFEIASYAD
ncbi:MAG: VOC family protein [Pseudogulbenkiania sp.]|nr:VOC family protein [Pseudogulbenkiania sp.]